MNTKIALISALFVGTLGVGLMAGPSGVAPANAAPTQCWAGYHVDSGGNCQSDNPVLDTRCPPNLMAQVSPSANGYWCVPIPRGY